MSYEGSIHPTVKRLSAALGAEITGLSLRNPSEELGETIEALLLEHQVPFFPDQHIDVTLMSRLANYSDRLRGTQTSNRIRSSIPSCFD